jgi:23S rRNA pseudouridine1911/1915/1917 synthase
VDRFCLTFEVAAEDTGKLLRDFLKKNLVSKAALVDIKFNGGALLVNGSAVTVRYRLNEGDTVEVYFPIEAPSSVMIAEDIPLNVVFEDDYVMVVNKPAGIASIPSREHRSGTLANGILYYYQAKGYEATIHIVTRLDRDTSGLMLIAKHRHAHHLFSLQHKGYEIKRRYEAVVHGVIGDCQGTVDVPIGRKDTSIIERVVREDGQKAVTHYEVIGRGKDSTTHVSLRLETGRTHQIRVHMAHLGHPLVGDSLYGGCVGVIQRQALHSCELSFYHPFEGRQYSFDCGLPADMRRLL